MAEPLIPTPQDGQLLLQDTTTKTASYNTPGLDLGAGFAPGSMGVPVAGVVAVTALDTADGNEIYSFTLQESSDNASFTAAGTATPVVGAGGHVVRGWATKRYVRLAVIISGTTPSITFKSYLNPLP